MRGDHYDMTAWRRMFEAFHKTLGYSLLGLASVTILLGLWNANGPVWMWFMLGSWWLGIGLAFYMMQRRGMAIDTYQAIWGPEPIHPGNARKGTGSEARRVNEGESDVR